MLQLLIVAIVVLAIAIFVLGYLWIVNPRKRAAQQAHTAYFQPPHTQPWSAAEHGRGVR